MLEVLMRTAEPTITFHALQVCISHYYAHLQCIECVQLLLLGMGTARMAATE
jgi:hypothetical protein